MDFSPEDQSFWNEEDEKPSALKLFLFWAIALPLCWAVPVGLVWVVLKVWPGEGM